MSDTKPSYSFALFPFLKTGQPQQIGDLTFRSTEDASELNKDQQEHLKVIATMLFLKDDLRIISASFACAQSVESDDSSIELRKLERIQAAVAYCYTIPHNILGDLALTYEHASMIIFTPALVSIHLVRPEYHVAPTESLEAPQTDQFGRLHGYNGIYNFKDYFWVVKGSRLYPPVPHLGLNISQDLSRDLGHSLKTRVEYQLLLDLLQKPLTPVSDRIFLPRLSGSTGQTAGPLRKTSQS